jgi:hypothetical protein
VWRTWFCPGESSPEAISVWTGEAPIQQQHGAIHQSLQFTANSFDWVCVRKNQKLGVMIHIFGQDFSYNQDYCLFFIVHEVVCGILLSFQPCGRSTYAPDLTT